MLPKDFCTAINRSSELMDFYISVFLAGSLSLSNNYQGGKETPGNAPCWLGNRWIQSPECLESEIKK